MAILTGLIDGPAADPRIVELVTLTRDMVRLATAYEITVQQLDELDNLIDRRAVLLEDIFGVTAVTFNNHMLHHLTTSLRRNGPAACTWCWAAERKNGIIAKRIANTNKTRIQIQLIKMAS